MHSNMLELKNPVLMLSSGFEPLFQTTWMRALTAVFGGRAEVIESHETLTIGVVNGSYPYPVKVRFTSGVIVARIRGISSDALLSRKNIYLRDNGSCQYCATKLSFNSATVDHVIPKSRGGSNLWENVVLACEKCNQKKGARSPKEANMPLQKRPRAPSINELIYRRID